MNHMLNLQDIKSQYRALLQPLKWILGCSILYAGLLILLNKFFIFLYM